MSYYYAQLLGVDNLSLHQFTTQELPTWGRKCSRQLAQEFDLCRDEFIFLAGDKYTRSISVSLKSYSTPLNGLRMGEQLAWLKNQTHPRLTTDIAVEKSAGLFTDLRTLTSNKSFP